MTKKKPDYSELGRKRAESLTQEERSSIASMGAKACNDSLTPEQRRERASKAARARWRKYYESKET